MFDDATVTGDDQSQASDEGADDMGAVMGGPLGGGAQPPVTDETNLVIPDEVREKYPELVQLIMETESMNDDERNYWYQTLLIMNEEQVKNLYQILVTEQQNLAAIDQKAQDEMNKLNDKQVAEWKEFEDKERKKMIKDAEKQAEQKEAEEEKNLLDELDQI